MPTINMHSLLHFNTRYIPPLYWLLIDSMLTVGEPKKKKRIKI